MDSIRASFLYTSLSFDSVMVSGTQFINLITQLKRLNKILLCIVCCYYLHVDGRILDIDILEMQKQHYLKDGRISDIDILEIQKHHHHFNICVLI